MARSITVVLTPLYVKTRVLSGLGDGLACAEGCHDALVDLSRKEAFQASDDLAFGPAIGGASGDVVAGWLVESHADDDGSIEGGVGVSVAASIEAVPAGGHPGRGRDRTRTAERREGGFRTNPVGIIADEYVRCAPRVPAPSGSQAAMPAGDNQMVMSPRQISARSEAAQFWTWYCVLYVGWTLDFIHPVWSAPSQPHSGFVHQRR